MLNVSSDFLSAIKQGSRTVSASIGYDDKALTNSLPNGDFSNGTTGWTPSGSTLSASNKVLSTTGTGASATISMQDSTTNIRTSGHVYYVRGKARVTDSVCTKITLLVAGGIAFNQLNPTQNTWYTLSGVLTASANTSTVASVQAVYADSATANTKVLQCQQMIVIDLTAMFGVGKEPTKAWVDSMLAKVGWFNGTKNVPSQFLGDRVFTNRLTNGNYATTSNWSNVGNGFTWSVANNIGTLTNLGSSASGYKLYQTVPVLGGHKYYFRVAMLSNSSLDGVSLSTKLVGYKAHSGSGAFESLSVVATASADGDGECRALNTSRVGDVSANPVKVKEAILVDLTALYGTGNEPTKEFMDNLISTYGWFNTLQLLEDTCILSDFNIDSSLGNGNLPSIGTTISNKLTLSVINDATLPQTLIGKTLRPYVAIDVTGTGSYEWVKLGEFYADYDGVDIGKLETTLEAFDMMAVYMDTTYTAMAGLTMTVQGVLNDLATNYGVKFATQSGLPTSTVISIAPVGSVRQVISSMASLMSTNATIDGDGCVKFIFMNTVPSATFCMGLDNYSSFKLQPDSLISFTELILKDGNNDVPWGDTSGYALSFQNPQVKILDDVKAVYNRIFPINYYAYTMKAQGMPHLELGDVISFTYVKLDGTQSTINIPILKHKFTFKGAFVSEFSASAPQQQTTSVTVTSGSSLADAVDVTYNDLNEAVEIATKQITGNQGGFVTTVLNKDNQPLELVVSNTPDYNTADKVWRWNASGLGFSSNGYNGDFGLALTADGQIVADKITTGILDANIIKAGIIKDVKNQSWINMADGTFNFGNGKLVWDGSAFNINFAGTSLETALNGKVDDADFSPYQSNISFNNGIITLGKVGNPFSVNVTNQAVEFIDKGTTGGTLNLTAISGNGTSVTCTYATQAVVPYQVGGYAQIAGCSTSAYNGTWLITSCTTTQVVLQCTATGTVSSGFGTIQYGSSPNTVAYINGQKMYISNLQATQTMQVGNHQITKYDSEITLIKYAG